MPAQGPAAAIRGAGINPLLDAATQLLALANQLRGTPSHSDVNALRAEVVGEIQAFEGAARAAGATPEHVRAARYALCALLDETVLSTPWGSNSAWASDTLLSSFHREAWGGEKFFQILDRMLQEPSRNLDLLELMYVCLALGFEGQYRVMERGRSKLDEIQDNLYRTLRLQLGEFERELSPRWRGVEDRRNALIRYVPLWVVGAVAGVVLIGTFLGFRVALSNAADPVFRELGQVGRQPAVEFDRPVPAARPLGLARLLAADIDSGSIALEEQGGQALIRLRGDGLFASGSGAVSRAYLPLLGRIGDALEQVPGRILVLGHTDNIPIRSLQFQSNWDLSRARAVSVSEVLAQQLSQTGRLIPEGRADTEPLVPNDTRENRARNRRVEIAVLAR